MLCIAQQLAAIAPGAVVAQGFADLNWPQVVASVLGIALGVFFARKQIRRWTQRD